MHRDAAAVHLDEPLDEMQSDPESGMRSIERTIDLREHLEDAGAFVDRNADARVADDHHGIVAVTLDDNGDASPGFGVLARIVEQVAEHLTEASGIGIQRDWLCRRNERQLVLILLDQWTGHLHR